MQAAAEGRISSAALDDLFDEAVRDTLRRFEATGSPVITDGEQRKPSFATYPVAGLANIAPGGVTIPFEDGHTRQLPLLTEGPFRYATPAWSYLDGARDQTTRAAQAGGHLGLGAEPAVPGRRARWLLARRVRRGPRRRRRPTRSAASWPGAPPRRSTSPRRGCRSSSIPSGGLLDAFVDLNNLVLARLTDEERSQGRRAHLPRRRPRLDAQRRRRLRGAAPRPVPPRTSTGSSSSSRARPTGSACSASSASRRPASAGSSSASSTPSSSASRRREEVADRVLEAARFIDPDHLGTTDDCGFSPFGDDVSTSRDTAFAKIAARVEGTRIASERLGV